MKIGIGMEHTDDPIGDLEIYRILSDKLRLQIIKLLMKGRMSVTDIISETGESQSLISHKLKDMRENGIVVSYRSGKNIIYDLPSTGLSDLVMVGENIGQTISKTCDCVECQEEKSSVS